MARSGDMDIKFNDLSSVVLRAPRVVEATKVIAESGVRAAKVAAPVDSGAYRDGIRLERHEAKYRTVWRAVGSDAKTMLIESKLGIFARVLKSLSRRG